MRFFNILVTGANGFIGKALTNYLAYYFDVNVFKYTKEITDSEALDAAFQEFKPDYVYHLAASYSDKLSNFVRVQNYKTNLIGTANVINACVKHDVKRLIFTSSTAIYKPNSTQILTENSPLMPSTPYGIAKMASELDIQAANKLFGLQYTILRMHIAYGGHQPYNKYRNVVRMFIEKIIKEDTTPLYGDGDQRCSFIYVDDIVEALHSCILEPKTVNSIINIGNTEQTTIKDLISEIELATGKKAKINHIPNFTNLDYNISFEKYHSIFPHLKMSTLKEGIIKTVASNITGTHNIPKQITYEIEKNLPENWK